MKNKYPVLPWGVRRSGTPVDPSATVCPDPAWQLGSGRCQVRGRQPLHTAPSVYSAAQVPAPLQPRPYCTELTGVTMDRSWINSRLFGKPHLDGVSEFMKLVSENFGADEQILGFLDIKDWWIYHGEPMEDTMIENTGHQDEQIDFTADVNLNEVEEGDPNDRIPDMKLCAKTLKIDVLHRMKDEIPIILCKLERIFPPPFFDVMLHLAVHLPDEAILRGPVQYGWMYLVERRLYTLKRFVRNMARPEGSIAEAYVAKECLMACSRLKWNPFFFAMRRRQVVKTPSEVVAQVLPKSKFLQNIGLRPAAPKRSSKAINDARVIELEAEVAAGKQDKELKDEMETLKKKMEESRK
ncbi:unnamed protein product [Miscanthus lutarioriparius]|uniref:DUF4218 domain-containing protein n=1 Tax=Miscanthus lutarioriparius TaxID=422564 RepID=A0A811MKN5_9POAL|nr:unnamed protein product [Miscanthus lutarioriparius]